MKEEPYAETLFHDDVVSPLDESLPTVADLQALQAYMPMLMASGGYDNLINYYAGGESWLIPPTMAINDAGYAANRAGGLVNPGPHSQDGFISFAAKPSEAAATSSSMALAADLGSLY
jgi:hypothetical protein